MILLVWAFISILSITVSGQSSDCKTSTDGDIEFWVNMATNARSITRMVATGSMTFTTLETTGNTQLGSTSSNTVTVPGILQVDENVRSQKLELMYDGTYQDLSEVIKNLQEQINNLKS